MKNQKLKHIFILIFGTFIVSSKIQAMLAPQVYCTELNLSKNYFEPGEEIKGTVSLWNYEEYVMSDLVFHFQLLGKEINGVPTQMIDEKISKETFTLLPGEKTTKSFSYSLPSNLPQGDFKFRIQLANSRGEEMGWIDRVISVGGEGKFLTLDNYWIVKDGKDLSPGGGVYYQPGEICEVRFDVTNNSKFTITAFPKITTYKRNVGQFLNEIEKEAIILEPGAKKTIKTTLPKLDKPETYLSEIRLYDVESKAPISNSIYFRWIISGENDAEILFVQPDKSSYQAGEEAKIKIQFTGPADFKVEGGEGCIKVNLYDQKGNLVGQKEECRKLEVGEITLKVPVKESVDNPKIETQIVKNGKILDQYEFQTKPAVEKVPEEIKKVSFFEKNKKIIIGLALIILIVGIIIYYLKMRGIKILILLALFSIGILFGNYVLAATEVTRDCCTTTLAFNYPLPDQTYKVGDPINFSGKFHVTVCGDGLFFNKVTFYITEDKEIPIRDCAGRPTSSCGEEKNEVCQLSPTYCYGATSATYTTCDFKWYNQVKYLDTNAIDPETNRPYKIYKLGEIYPPDVIGNYANPAEVEYNQTFIIPSDLGFAGPVRFYVQYSGTHWNDHWHWNITYQKGYINSPPTASNLSEIQNCCAWGTTPQVAPGLAITLNWTYSDPDGDSQSAYEIWLDEDQNRLNPANPNPRFKFSAQNSSNAYALDLNDNQVAQVAGGYRYPLSWNKTYYWRVKVKDSAGNWSAPSEIHSFKTPLHASPNVNFSWTPQKPTLNEVVKFIDLSEVYGGATKFSWEWTFQSGDPPSSILQNPTTTFKSTGSKTVTLKVTDSDSLSCSNSKTIQIRLPLPKWKEIPLLMKKFLASIFYSF